jgi:hypothetical protein
LKLISHRRREVTEGGLRSDCGRLFGGQLGFWAGKTRITESIAQRSRRSQRRIKVRLRKALWWTAWLLGGKDTHHGEHRTEVTEVTEGGLRFGCGRLFGGQLGFWAGKTRIGESIAQRSRRSQRRIKVRLRKALWWTAWLLGGKDGNG